MRALLIVGVATLVLGVARAGETLRVGAWSLPLPVGLPAAAARWPAGDAPSPARIELGRALFFDPRLSRDATVACASCHDPAHGLADPRPRSLGVGAAASRRHAPAAVNRLFSAAQFWDGRAADLETQLRFPLLDPHEMAMPSTDAVAAAVRAVPGYAPLFAAAYGDARVDFDRIARALADYERTLVSGDSPFDRFAAGDATALSPAARRGLTAFRGRGHCATCHLGPNFTDERFHNTGIGMAAPAPDLGRWTVTQRDEDRGAFKTPTLRNVAQTAPYMHDGSLATLAEVIAHYDAGGLRNAWLSRELQPLMLSEQERRDLIAFLAALSGPIANASPPSQLPR
ncbi:MAG: cytochrome c peroxidase [Deltaproteobacteria bacterium]|nr:cytochrome c peroxidase [Deltaproteobacteria bacterium]